MHAAHPDSKPARTSRRPAGVWGSGGGLARRSRDRDGGATGRRDGGFSLVELVVVLAVTAMLASLLLPALGAAREAGRASVCRSNLRQLGQANLIYALDHRGHFVLAAEDVFVGFGGTKRWHGERESAGVDPDPARNTFDPTLSPLRGYFGERGRVKACPSFVEAVTDGSANAFEAGTGGYGYNQHYIGGRSDKHGFTPAAAAESATIDEVRSPSATVMFTDAAFRQGTATAPYVIEYSFCEPPLQPGSTRTRPLPSIHFRHDRSTHVAWVDGHVDAERYAFTHAAFAEVHRELGIGWFAPDDNARFDLE